MRAYQLQRYDGPDGLVVTEVPAPTPGPDEVLVEVRAIGVNFPDLLMTFGQYQLKPALPTVPGCEVAGIVSSAPAGADVQVGDRVSAFIWQGGYAQQAVVPVPSVSPMPAGMDFTTAAAMIVNYQTTLFALARRGRLVAGERVLVLGAAGGVGSAAVQIASALGAGVIAGVADESQIPTARSAGADDVLVLGDGFSRDILDRTGGRGVDVVVDPLGGGFTGEAVRVLAPEGRLLIVGFAAGDVPSLRTNRLLLRNVDLVGVAYGAFLDVEPQLMRTQAAQLNRLVEGGVLAPGAGSTYGFDELPQALRDLREGRIRGKAVVVVP